MSGADPNVDPRPEWYAQGLRFSCTQCGNCCTGPPGAVWFTEEEADRMARRLGLTREAFYQRYARAIGDRWSLTEREGEHGLDCVFLDRTSVPGRAICSIYEDRPTQCRTWPFWPENLQSRRAWITAAKRTPCPGMDNGRLYPLVEIRIFRSS